MIKPAVIFVLGGPGSGKGTVCKGLAEKTGFHHLSAGNLLRKAIQDKSEKGQMIQEIIDEGKIVPAEITVDILDEAIAKSGKKTFIIDGFPRNSDNSSDWNEKMREKCKFRTILVLDCDEKCMLDRIMGRQEGRSDDTEEIFKKRMEVFKRETLPIVSKYSLIGKVIKIDATGSREEVLDLALRSEGLVKHLKGVGNLIKTEETKNTS